MAEAAGTRAEVAVTPLASAEDTLEAAFMALTEADTAAVTGTAVFAVDTGMAIAAGDMVVLGWVLLTRPGITAPAITTPITITPTITAIPMRLRMATITHIPPMDTATDIRVLALWSAAA